MTVQRIPLKDKLQTASAMYDLISRYHTDLDSVFVSKSNKALPVSQLPLQDFYNLVRRIPYRQDTKPVEVLARPYYLLKGKDKGLDCKKKALLLGSYFKYHKIPFRLIGTSSRSDKSIHHVFPQVKLSGNWQNADATYSDYYLFQPKEVTAFEIL
jgi:hypothetical protein